MGASLIPFVPYCPVCDQVMPRPMETLESWGAFIGFAHLLQQLPTPGDIDRLLSHIPDRDKQIATRRDLLAFVEHLEAHNGCGPFTLRSVDGQQLCVPFARVKE